MLTFVGNTAKLGSPLFKQKNSFSKRVVFEYADKSTMSLKFDEPLNRIVYDHLSPEVPSLKGVYSYYVPDFSYDAFVWEEDSWLLKEDVIAINKPGEDKKTTVFVLDEKTGELKEKKLQNDWVNPADPNKKNDIGHVARTPESEAINLEENNDEPKIKRNRRDRRNPNGLSVTTGKYKPKKRHKR